MPRRRFVVASCLLAAALGAAPAQALTAAQLQAKLRGYERRMGPSSGAIVRDLDARETLFAVRADAPRVPASNEKLLTTATALWRFGATGTLDTTLRASAAPGADGVLRGSVELVGAGDPYLDDTGLAGLAAQVADAGIERITGGVVGDASLLDDRVGSYDSGWAYDSDLGGRLSGLVVDEGRGADPALHAASVMRRALLAADVAVGGRSRSGTLANATQVLGTAPSLPMQQLAARINVPSDNYAAELLLKDVGARFGTAGSTPAGAVVVRRTLAEAGVKASVVDGSGLSPADRVSPRNLLRLLSYDAGHGGALRPTLAVAGRSGTLADRMRGTAASGRCQAKTGTLDGVSALSGYCTTAGGATVAFSFVENGVCNVCAKRVEDRMVAAIARYSVPPPG